MRAALFAVLCCLSAPFAWAQTVTVRASPQPSYVEKGAHQQWLNFDLLLENASAAELKVSGIELWVFDSNGALVHRDFVDRDSRRHAELIPDRKIPARGRLMIFNPFHTFPADLDTHELRYRFTLAEGDNKAVHADATVRPTNYQPKTRLILPLRGRLLVWDGHDYASHHRRLDYSVPIFGIENQYLTNFQRFSFDFVLVDEQGHMSRQPAQTTVDFYRHDPANNSSFYGFGADVLATADGTVVELHDGGADDLRFDPNELKTRETAYGGNYVIIDHGTGEFSWFGHLKQNSVRVKVGQKVKQGEVIGAVGASGSSLFPHLHYELRTGPGAGKAEGLPAYFTGFRRAGGKSAIKTPTPVNTGDVLYVP